MAKSKTKVKKKFDNNNRGVLFQNDKDGNPNRPDFRGNIKIVVKDHEIIDNGDETYTIARYISAWHENNDSVGGYLSLAVGDADKKVHGEPEDE